ncbi:hypothetical protein BT93_E2219 [Corymbia citriodora subsp. variegata]|nr:hypothetical protein BT93_E2219 [Corymbia citriodora subsp. variegata]
MEFDSNRETTTFKVFNTAAKKRMTTFCSVCYPWGVFPFMVHEGVGLQCLKVQARNVRRNATSCSFAGNI